MQDGVSVAIGANNSLRVLGASISKFSTQPPISKELSESEFSKSAVVLKFSLALLSISGSEGVNSNFKDFRPSMQYKLKSKEYY
jgi:hypothetical protein